MGIKVENRLRELRKKKGSTQEQLATELGVTRQTVISIERGEYIPTTGLSLRIAKYFNTQVEKIFWLAGN
ncbi:MAG: helix-turn-helix transcriptional regulator [bacterium]|nr:helix-turn-helix transcriptional regulator [bacterium]